MSHLKALLSTAVVVRAALAWLVSLSAKGCGDDAGKWITLTLLTGVAGAMKYIRDGH